jgi:DNA mismatch endonuclease (patch repair protein)
MRRIRGKDTVPELTLRRTLHRLGYRYRLHRRDLPGSPDLVFPRQHKVIFVHGCFWHGHGSGCPLSHVPRSNSAYWQAKFLRNRRRDDKKLSDLAALGWQALVVWECELRDTDQVIHTVQQFLTANR